MTPLMLRSIDPMLSWALVVAFIVIRDDDSRTFKIMLRTTGHESREPMNALVITFTNSLILKV